MTLGYVIVNGIIGNVVEPRLMGRELGISSVVVLLSLLFWGCPIGLFLSVPLTIVLAVALNASPHARPMAIMLGSDVARAEASDRNWYGRGLKSAAINPAPHDRAILTCAAMYQWRPISERVRLGR